MKRTLPQLFQTFLLVTALIFGANPNAYAQDRCTRYPDTCQEAANTKLREIIIGGQVACKCSIDPGAFQQYAASCQQSAENQSYFLETMNLSPCKYPDRCHNPCVPP